MNKQENSKPEYSKPEYSKPMIRKNLIEQFLVQRGGLHIPKRDMKGFETMGQIIKDHPESALSPTGMPLADFEKNLMGAMRESIGHTRMVSIQGVLVGVVGEGSNTEGLCLPYYTTGSVREEWDHTRLNDHIGDVVKYASAEVLGMRHLSFQPMARMSGVPILWNAIYGVLNVYELHGTMQRTMSTGVRVSLTKAEGCVVCAKPKDVRYITFPASEIIPRLVCIDSNGDAPLLQAEQREWTLVSALQEMERNTN